MLRRPGSGRPDLMRPYSLHLPSLDECSNNEAAPRSQYGSLRWEDGSSRPSSACYPQDPFASNEWSRSVASKRNSVQSSRSSLLPQPRRFSSGTTPAGPRMIEPSMSSPSILTSPNSSMDAQSRIPVPVQRRGTHQNKNFYVVGRKPVHDPGVEVQAPRTAQSDESPSPSPGTISAKAFRRSVASTHSIMQLDANASTLSFQSTASGGVGIRPRSKSHSSQIPQPKTKPRRVVSESTPVSRGDTHGGKDEEENESELPYHLSMPPYDGIQQQRAPWLNQAHNQPSTPSLSDFGEAGSFFREIMDSRDEEPQHSGTRSGSKLIENLGTQDSHEVEDAQRTGVCDTEPIALLQAMANETQRMLDERYGVLPEAAAPPIPPSPLELELQRANTTKSTSTVPHPKRVPPPALPSPALTPKPKTSQASVSQVPSPQSSNFVRISRRTPSSSPLALQTNGIRKAHKAKQPSLLGRLFSPTKPKSTPVSHSVRPAARPAWITGTFVIDPTLRVPGGILSAASMVTPTRNSAYLANLGAGKKNLVLEVQNGGIDATVKLVSTACEAKANAVVTKVELNLLGSTAKAHIVLDKDGNLKDKKVRKSAKAKGGEEKEEVYPIVARIDAPNPRPPLYLIASTVASPSIEHNQKQGTPSKLDAKDYVLVETPLSPPISPRPNKSSSPSTKPSSEGKARSGQRLSRTSTGGTTSPLNSGAVNGNLDSNRVSRSGTGKRLSKASTTTTNASAAAIARPYHLPSSLVTNTSQGSAEDHNENDSSTSTLPFPATASHSISTVVASPLILTSHGAHDPTVDPKRLSSASPIHLALPTTFRGPLSIAVLSVSEEGGVGAHVHMSPAVQRMAVLLQETSAEGEGRQVWFVGGLGLAAEHEAGDGDEDSIFSDEDNEDNDAIFSGVWNMGGEVAKTGESRANGRGKGGKAERNGMSKMNKSTTTLATSKQSRLPKPRRAVSGREAPTPTPRSSESDSADHQCVPLNGLNGLNGAGSDRGRGSWEGGRGYSPQEEWRGDRVDLVVGRGKIFLRFWDECVPGAGLGLGMGAVVGNW